MNLLKYLSIILLIFSLSGSISSTFAASGETPIQINQATQAENIIEFSIFSRPDCVHCISLKKFLDAEFASGSKIQPRYYDINLPENAALYDQFTQTNNLSKVTPILLVGNQIIEGYQSPETTGRMIKEWVATMKESSLFENAKEKLSSKKSGEWCTTEGCEIDKNAMYVDLPFVGIINLKEYSLPILAAVLGFVDGFNPCAMWVLVMFLSILVQSGSRKKMFQIAGIFILAEAIMYFMILNVWYKTWDFVKLDHIVTPIIGLISLAAGWFFLYEFFTNKDGECKVTSVDQKRKLTQQIKKIAEAPMSIAIFLTTIGIAFSVNVIEFACSIGIPQAFTKLLEMSSLGFAAKQGYIGLYTLFYMFDDFLVFGIALYAFKYLHLTSKYTRYCLAIGGIIMLILGYFFLFDPTALKMIVA